ncbi:hypothetical protein PGB90_007218 [Kerria lacca]
MLRNELEINDLDANSKRTPPNCARCKNHGIKNLLVGHKRYCLYWKCNCKKCILTIEKRQIMARSTAIRRAEKQHKKKIEEWKKTIKEGRSKDELIPTESLEYLNPVAAPIPMGQAFSSYSPSLKCNQDEFSSSTLSIKKSKFSFDFKGEYYY